MEKIKYLVNRLFNMNYKNCFSKINEISKKRKTPKIFIIIDMIKCSILYGSGYMDYYLFDMYDMSNDERKTIITRGINNKLIKKYNDKNYIHIFENKDEFLNKFKYFVKRDFLILNNNYEEFVYFITKHKIFFAKPRQGSCGKGIKKITISLGDNIKELYESLINDNLTILEDVIIQNDKLTNLNPSCINTIRVVTINNNKTCDAVIAYLRCGNGLDVDNFNSNGFTCPIDIKTGIINYPLVDKKGNIFYKHPKTNINIIGFKIPYFKNIINMCKKMAQVIPNVGMVGWDIAVTKNSYCVVEGNDFPGHDIYNLQCHRNKKGGDLPLFSKYL